MEPGKTSELEPGPQESKPGMKSELEPLKKSELEPPSLQCWRSDLVGAAVGGAGALDKPERRG